MDQLDTAPVPLVSVAELLAPANEQMTLAMGKWLDAVPSKTGAAVREFSVGEEMATTGGIATNVAVNAKFGCIMNDKDSSDTLGPMLGSHLLKVDNGPGSAVIL